MTSLGPQIAMSSEFTEQKRPNKALQATAAVLCGSGASEEHNAVVAGARALPAAVPELGR